MNFLLTVMACVNLYAFYFNVNIFTFFGGYWIFLFCFAVTNFQIVIFLFKRADDITNLVTDTTLLVHFFGKKGKAELNFEDFYR